MSESKSNSGVTPLHYPLEAIPENGELISITPGVNWLRMPLPFSLNHINLWAIEGDEEWSIVDTGIGNEQTLNLWQDIHNKYGNNKPLKNVFITHMHPDHIGLAGDLTRTFNAELSITRTEYLTFNLVLNKAHKGATEVEESFFRAAGYNEKQLAQFHDNFGAFRKIVTPLPTRFRRLQEGQMVEIGGHQWRVIIGSGHTHEHACFFCKELNIIISGDQILPTISSNISVHSVEPYENPLKEWLDSCRKLIKELPADVLVLPSHGKPFIGAHTRLNALIDEHERDLAELKNFCQTPQRAIDVFSVLFKTEINQFNLVMAIGESIAHLNCLIARNEMTVTMNSEGVNYYQTLA